jgi:alpha-mannosidase
MDVRLYRGERRVEFAIDVEWDGRGGFLAAHLPFPDEGDLAGDMPFCVEDKPLGDEPWVGIERTREGMFIARSFMDWTDGDRSIAYISHDGDRWFIFDRERNELAHILVNSADEPYAGWQESINRRIRGVGRHCFTFSVVPHEGNWRQAGLWQLSERLRTPVLETLPTFGGDLPASGGMLSVSPPGVALSACHRDDERLLVRVFDTVGAGGESQITLPFKVAEAELVDLNGFPLDEGEAQADGNSVSLRLSPWQIATVAVTPADA